jgi:hypothetical protein
MAIKLTTTHDAARLHGVKFLIYGGAGTGKTSLCATAPAPIIISAEAGLLSLRDTNIPVVQVSTLQDLGEAYAFVTQSEDAKDIETICLDSLSEIGEVCLSAERAATNDGRRAYGEMQDKMQKLIRNFRDIEGRHIYFSAKLERQEDDHKVVTYQPSMPGRQVGPALPYMFDEVFALRAEDDAEGQIQRWLQTQPDKQYTAKDRSGRLDRFETPNLSAIINKIIEE